MRAIPGFGIEKNGDPYSSLSTSYSGTRYFKIEFSLLTYRHD